MYIFVILENNINGDKMKKEYAEEVLNGIDMGIVGIEHVEEKIENKSLKRLVSKQKKEYEELKKELLSLYPDINRKSNIMAGMMLEVKTIFANDNDIVKMLMQGCNMAIISMTEIIHDLGITDMKLRKLANDLEDVSKRYEEKLKAYL